MRGATLMSANPMSRLSRTGRAGCFPGRGVLGGASSLEATAIDPGSTAWMLASSALVLLMVPGLALFYGGMVRKKNVLTTMMMSFVAMAVIGVQWVAWGYALAFGKSIGGVIGWDAG